jgi:DNA-binding beta-propeller fold protein YncE
MNRVIVLTLAALALGPQAAVAQKPSLQGGAVVASEPGKVAVVAAAKVTATVVAIDKTTRTVTLKGPQRTVDVVAGEEVRNFDQIRLGDRVVVEYREALTLELKKTRTTDAPTDTGMAARATPGERPAVAAGREITLLADVVGVDAKKSIISLKGPQGNVVDLKVQNPDHFKVVKKGDQVEVVYTIAVAVAVTPAPASGGKKK